MFYNDRDDAIKELALVGFKDACNQLKRFLDNLPEELEGVEEITGNYIDFLSSNAFLIKELGDPWKFYTTYDFLLLEEADRLLTQNQSNTLAELRYKANELRKRDGARCGLEEEQLDEFINKKYAADAATKYADPRDILKLAEDFYY